METKMNSSKGVFIFSAASLFSSHLVHRFNAGNKINCIVVAGYGLVNLLNELGVDCLENSLAYLSSSVVNGELALISLGAQSQFLVTPDRLNSFVARTRT